MHWTRMHTDHRYANSVRIQSLGVTLLLIATPLLMLLREGRAFVIWQSALRGADPPSTLGVRLAGRRWMPELLRVSASRAAAAVLAAEHSEDPSAQHRQGVALLLLGRTTDAVRRLHAAARRAPSAPHWNDAAAASLVLARQSGDGEQLIGALVAADRALEIAPTMREAQFNRAAALQAMGVAVAAVKQWERLMRQNDALIWQNEVLTRFAAVDREVKSRVSALKLAAEMESVASPDVLRLTTESPERTRRHAESVLLASWAEAVVARQAAVATRQLTTACAVGTTLCHMSGECFLVDVCSAIKAAGPVTAQRVAEAHLLYRAGRVELRAMQPRKAAKTISHAAKRFREVGSPMAFVADLYAAIAVRNDSRPDEAKKMLKSLLSSTQRRPYLALRAEAHRELSLCLGAVGLWSDALAALKTAQTQFAALRELENAGDVAVASIGIFSMTGQHASALGESVRAFRMLSRAGTGDRLAAAVAAAAYAQIRCRRWDVALALAKIEQELPVGRDGALLRTNSLVRVAAIEAARGEHIRAAHAIERARTAANDVPNDFREPLLGEIDAVAGAIARRNRSPDAITLLTRSIAFYEKSMQSYALPTLYMERGRAFAALDDSARAAVDFDRGIELLETQRNRTTERWLQIGIFDDAAELFDEATSLALARGDVNSAFLYVERRRGRALAERLGFAAEAARRFRIEELQNTLERDQMLLEYVHLRGSMFLFVVNSDSVEVQRLSAKAIELTAASHALVNAFEKHDLSRARLLLQSLHSPLLGPVEPRLARTRTIIVVPDPLIERVPFAALVNKAGRYVIESSIIATAPSASAYMAGAIRGHSGRRARVIAFGNPTVPGRLDNLPGAEEEAKLVARCYRAGIAHTGREVHAAALQSAIRSADVVHFGGHAQSAPYDPGRSAILLSSGAMSARSIAGITGVRAEIVVLAACSTAGGTGVTIEGAPVLAHAFLLSGVATVIGTLRDIDDAEATPLMLRVHTGLAAGKRAASALRDAQLAMLYDAQPANRDPSRWAAFIATGVP